MTRVDQMYDVSDIASFDPIREIDPGTSLLVTGPPMTGKESLALSLLAEGNKKHENSLIVTTDKNAEDILEEYTGMVGNNGAEIGIVDCSGNTDGQEGVNESMVKYVSSPADLTGISIHVSEFMDEFQKNQKQIRVAVTSVSTLLMYLDVETVFRFLHVFASRIQNAEALGVFVIDSTSVDYQTLSTIKQPFDGVIEIRESEGGSEVRIKGITSTPTDWCPLERS